LGHGKEFHVLAIRHAIETQGRSEARKPPRYPVVGLERSKMDVDEAEDFLPWVGRYVGRA